VCLHSSERVFVTHKNLKKKGDDALLISYVKPFKAVTGDTVSRWVKTVMIRAGIVTHLDPIVLEQLSCPRHT